MQKRPGSSYQYVNYKEYVLATYFYLGKIAKRNQTNEKKTKNKNIKKTTKNKNIKKNKNNCNGEKIMITSLNMTKIKIRGDASSVQN